jgi:hypothetical protein
MIAQAVVPQVRVAVNVDLGGQLAALLLLALFLIGFNTCAILGR